MLHRICELVKKICYRIYSFYKSQELFSVGKGFHTEYPLHLYGGRNIKIGDHFSCKKRIRLEAFGEKGETRIEIGDRVQMTWDCHIGAINRICIGNDVLIGSRVLITDHQHGEINAQALHLPPAKRPLYSKGPVVIGNNVWIGEGVAIMPGVTIGDHVIIGANSVVTASIPANCVVAGIPGKIIRQL